MNQLTKIRKNLNSSFAETVDSLSPDRESPANVNNSHYTSRIFDDDRSVKMVLRKRTPSKRTNLSDSFKEIALESAVDLQSTPKRGILKATDRDNRSTPKRYIGKNSSPPKSLRRSIRASSINASAKINIFLEDISPQMQAIKNVTRKRVDSENRTPSRTPQVTKQLHRSNNLTPTLQKQLYRSGNLTPTIQKRELPLPKEQSDGLDSIRMRLHVSAIPNTLPCREKEFSNISSYITGKLMDESGGCIYISGVPGTGKKIYCILN